MTETSDRDRKLSRCVTLFSLTVLLLGTGVNILRAVGAWHSLWRLESLPWSLSMPMVLLAGTSLVWVMVFAIVSWGLWRRRTWGRLATLSAVILYHGHIWLNHFLFDRSSYARQTWSLAVIDTGLTLLLVCGFLYWLSIRTRQECQERMNEFGSQDRETA